MSDTRAHTPYPATSHLSSRGPAGQQRRSAWIQLSRSSPAAVIVSVCGTLDAATTLPLADQLSTHLRAAAVVVLDLSEVDFLDTVGIRVVDTACRHAQHNGVCLRLAPNYSHSVDRALQAACRAGPDALNLAGVLADTTLDPSSNL